jgi:hypothetical protein
LQKEQEIDLMDDAALQVVLKKNGLPCYGSRAERIKRLKKVFNIDSFSP